MARFALGSRRMRRAGRLAAGFVFALLFGCAGPPPASAGPPSSVPAGLARIWIYRDYSPYISDNARPWVRLNGVVAGISEPGGAFSLDVRPGDYRVSVDSEGQDVNQFARVDVVAGQEVYIKVDNEPFWDCGRRWCRNTWYTIPELPQVGAAAVARLPYTAGQ